ncbi:MAG: YetF domain-containing protein [Candidatus Dormibacter sp.]
MGSLFKLSIPWWELVIRSLLIYAVFFVGLRIFGKRELGQFTTFDLVLILLVANALQPAITGPDNSLTGGIIIIASLLLVNRGVAMLRSHWPWFDELVEPGPTVIARAGQWLQKAMEEEGLSLEDGEMALREHGVATVDDVKLAVLEEDGSISVITKDAAGGEKGPRRRRRRVRFLRRG